MITGVAIRWGAFLVALPRPARHHQCLDAAHKLALAEPGGPFARTWALAKSGEQGFTDDHMRFLTRKQAWAHARQCGQPIVGGGVQGSILTSEDLW